MTEHSILFSAPIWKPVVGYEGRYEVSDHGHVRSLSTYRSTSGVVLSTWTQNRGHYHYVTLRNATVRQERGCIVSRRRRTRRDKRQPWPPHGDEE